MEDEVLRILIQSLQQPFNEEVCEEIAAKEIADNFERFTDWSIINCAKVAFKGGEQQSDTYMHCDEEIYFNSIAELYSYWNEHYNNEK